MGAALAGAFSAVAHGGPSTYAGLVGALGGTKAAAAELGISQREVQRQVAYDKAQRGESVKGQQQRKFSEAQQAKLADAVEKKDWSQERAKYKDGMKAHVAGDFRVSSHKSERDLEVVIDDPDALAALFDALEAHEWKEAAEVFNDAFMDAYGVPGAFWASVDELDIAPA